MAHKWMCRQGIDLKDFWSSDINKELLKKKVDTLEKSDKLKIWATDPEMINRMAKQRQSLEYPYLSLLWGLDSLLAYWPQGWVYFNEEVFIDYFSMWKILHLVVREYIVEET